ncbi:HAEPLYID family protein [Aureitalea marina]|uniref:Phosphoribosylformylglycinamidine synthase n=1 Tax=Aureitalea marina TaxID=930804 RepID=A0A2S7KMQ3_9FLAO|nr:HAEPLYID family protein [Aureitalea marina]PQB03914.1 phosphoribosylformylglycinamidine synthase [Aureitalea marina]
MRPFLSFSLLFLVIIGCIQRAYGQEEQSREERKLENERFDDALIEKVEDSEEPDKVLHAEPLYIDLIRDLGARKGEQEWNLGFGVLDRDGYNEIEALIEYEFAIIDRLGLEIEFPFSFFTVNEEGVVQPENKLNSLQLAGQYTLVVSKKAKFSFAIGYLHEFEFTSFKQYGKEDLYKGNVFNPFAVAAKRWGDNFHTLIYAGPVIERLFGTGMSEIDWQINTNLDYMISGTNNFIGIEFNKSFEDGDFDMTMRPQMRVTIDDHWMAGIVTGIPVEQENEGLSMFVRLIYEPD